MSISKIVCLLVAVGLVVLAVLAWQRMFGERTTALVESVSPDGMFRCTVTERASTARCQTEIVLEKRMNPKLTSGDDLWGEIKREKVYNDSACRSNYSVDWEYDDKHRTTGIVVFGDFGTPPFPGEVLLTTSFSPEQSN